MLGDTAMCLNPYYLKEKGIYVSCGKCFECKQKISREWAFRILLESKLYEKNCFITLTYNDDNLPEDEGIHRRELQLFMKRLRKSLEPKKIRFFYCGEYGKRFGRPHYHCIIFDYFPDDAYFWQKDNSGEDLFRSPSLEKIWTKGFSSVGLLTYDSAYYCAKYMQKAPPPELEIDKPFIGMSNRPGIGRDAINVNWLESDKMYVNGKYMKLPRYFLKILEEKDPEAVAKIKSDRIKWLDELPKVSYQDVETGEYFETIDYDLINQLRNDGIKRRKEKLEKVLNRPLDKNGFPVL